MKQEFGQRFLVIYSGVLTIAFAAVVLMGASSTTTRAAFGEIDVQRINVVEPDGTLRMVISDAVRAPGVIYRGREYPHPDGRKTAGMIFYNDEGTENGGLIFDGRKDANGKVASHGHLSFDNYEQDQAMVVEANQDEGDRKASFIQINDQPDYSLQSLFSLMQKNRGLPQSQQQAALQAFLKDHSQPASRVLLGRLQDSSSELALKDEKGRNRIVIRVAADGTPTLQFLDAAGKIVDELPRVVKGG